MAATITNDFKRVILRKIFDDINNSTNRYYIGIGKSEAWNTDDVAPAPTGSIKDARDAKAALQSMKSAGDVSFVVNRRNWTPGTIYDSWDDAIVGEGDNPFYIITEENNVYICLKESRDAAGNRNTSTVKPTHIDPLKPITMTDGYKWKYLFSLRPTDTTAFLSANFHNVRLADSSETGLGAQQYDVQAAAVRGQVLGVKVTNGGAGYSSAPTVTIEGDGSGATATAFVTGGEVTHIFIDSDTDSGMVTGRGYNFAGVKLTGGSPSTAASARAVIGDIFGEGIGADPRNDLKSTSLMFNTRPSGDESNTFFVGQDFRQVTLIKDPIDSDGAVITGSALGAAKYYEADDAGEAGQFVLDTIITGSTSGSTAKVVSFAGNKIYFTQNDSTGFGSFQAEDVTGSALGGGTNTATLVDGIIRYEDMDQRGDSASGTIMYIDNRSAVIRDSNQTEDLKVVIQI